MTKIHSIKISHYRRFEHFEQVFPDKNLIVLIGRGDSGKTTLLKAIQCVLSPSWNLSFSDYDFYNRDTTVSIEIECVLKDVPNELLKESKYGLYLQYLKKTGQICSDITNEEDGDVPVLTIKLTVNDDLEPNWKVTTLRETQEDKNISANDRAKLNMFMIADYIDNHFTYSRLSPLYALLRQDLEDKSQIDRKLTTLARQAYAAIEGASNFDEFDQSLKELSEVSSALGIYVEGLKAGIEYQDSTFTESNITLQRDNIPYRLHGKGSKRLLSLALQNRLTKDGGITLLDEVEQGLEPDRIINLIRFLKDQTSVQVFLTTHSSYALVEANWDNVFLMRENNKSLISFLEEDQAILRSQPESFFAKKIICCEGKTEQGVLRAIDSKLRSSSGKGFAAFGVVVANCKGGDKFYSTAKSFKRKGYPTAIFADNDVNQLREKADAALKDGIKLWIWDEGKALENQIFNDLPWQSLASMLDAINSVRDNLRIFNQIHLESKEDLVSISSTEQHKYREEYGDKAKKQSWFKNFEGGEIIGKAIFESLNDGTLDKNTTLYKHISSLLEWIKD